MTAVTMKKREARIGQASASPAAGFFHSPMSTSRRRCWVAAKEPKERKPCGAGMWRVGMGAKKGRNVSARADGMPMGSPLGFSIVCSSSRR
jgi:hypothetical protein